MLMRILLSTMTGIMTIWMSGCCCGPGAGPCGPCPSQCNNCDDAGYGQFPMVYGPLHGLTQLRKSMVCGSGCGEAYYDEWVSTPPDACDPCHDDQFVGGATPCVPFCWRPGTLFGLFGGLYGTRFCDGCGHSFDQCGCGPVGCDDGCGCDSGCGCDVGGGGGCSTCSSSHGTNQRYASQRGQRIDPRTARANAIRRGMSSSGTSGRMYR